jgi:hypothetical protein
MDSPNMETEEGMNTGKNRFQNDSEVEISLMEVREQVPDVISEFFNSKLPWDMTFAYSHTLMV